MHISSQTVMITGANRGIGRALTAALLAAGVEKIYATARKLEDVEAIDKLDARVTGYQLDITDRAAVNRAASELGAVTLLINNAGVLDFGSFTEAGPEAISRNFDTNFHGTLNMCTAFAPVISRVGGGAIVNLLTLVALASMPGLSVYNASKAAAWSMTQSLRATLAEDGVTLIGVFPGAVDTDMLAGVDMPKTAPADIARAIVAGIEADEEDIFPDAMSQGYYEKWRADHKAVEREFATM